jgi:hypothetical protein
VAAGSLWPEKTASITRRFDSDVRHAWIVAVDPPYSLERMAGIMAALRVTGETLPWVIVLDTWRERPGARALELVVRNDEGATFV